MEASEARLSELAEEGAIEGGTPFRLYARIAAANGTGWLRLRDDRGHLYEIGFRRGDPEFVRTDDPELSEERYLLARNVVRPEDLQGVEASQGRWIEALVGRGVLAPADAYQHLLAYSRGLLGRALLVEMGRYSWRGEAQLPAGLRLGDRWVLLASIGRRIPLESAETRLAPWLGVPVRRNPEARVPWENLGLTAVEARMLARIDGRRSLGELVAEYPDDAHAILRLGCFLSDAGLVLFGEEAGRPSGTDAAAAPVAEATDPGREAVLAELRERLAELERKNLFERLGVPTDAPSAAIRAAYLSLARKHHPDLGGSRGEVRALRAQIMALLNEAYDVLSDPKSRNQYLDELRSGASQKVDVTAILEAERKLHVAIALVRERRFEEAARELDEAIALYDGEAELWAYRAWVRLAAARDREAAKAQALADLERARRLGERSAVVFLLSARIANLLGDVASAIRYYQRCLEFEPGHPEATRELRVLESRRA